MSEIDEKYAQAERQATALLRAARRDRGLTQTELADRMAECGFPWTQPTVARVEHGQRHLSLAEARALMDILEQDRGIAYRRIEGLGSSTD